jgi:hypothetical protein
MMHLEKPHLRRPNPSQGAALLCDKTALLITTDTISGLTLRNWAWEIGILLHQLNDANKVLSRVEESPCTVNVLVIDSISVGEPISLALCDAIWMRNPDIQVVMFQAFQRSLTEDAVRNHLLKIHPVSSREGKEALKLALLKCWTDNDARGSGRTLL